MAKRHGPRTTAARILRDVVQGGRSLSGLLAAQLGSVDPAQQGLVQELCFGTLRWYPRLDALLDRLISKPLKAKDSDLRQLLLVGLYQLIYLETPPHAAVAETVNGCGELNKGWAKGLVNGVLRRVHREGEALLAAVDAQPAARLAHPQWLLDLLVEAWPDDWATIADGNNQRPPMTLRVNRRKSGRSDYLERLAAADIAAHPAPVAEGITLDQALPVQRLPGFGDGFCSVQDGAAQLAAHLLGAQPGERILDACAAPGGKTSHILELQPETEVVAIDSDGERLKRVEENFQRLGLDGQLVVADAGEPAEWWDGKSFDRILLDAPCSASGVIRRHPDIKLLRRAEDIALLVASQERLLERLWPLLRRGGMLVYATCSVLPQENARQIDAFLQRHADAGAVPIDESWGRPSGIGRQILPGEQEMDGFFYARLHKR